MSHTIIAGDGPAGLSAALLLAKNGHEATVHGEDDTAVHYALLRNYLGIDEEHGSDFVARSREQVARFGAELVETTIEEVSVDGDRVRATTADGDEVGGDYLLLAAGKAGGALASQLGIEAGPDGVEVDGDGRASVDRVYAAGRLVRPDRSQVVISAGAGAVAALDILSREAGEDVRDWDSPEDG